MLNVINVITTGLWKSLEVLIANVTLNSTESHQIVQEFVRMNVKLMNIAILMKRCARMDVDHMTSARKMKFVLSTINVKFTAVLI